MSLAERLAAAWYAPRLTPLTLPLAPLAAAFAALAGLRRALYRNGVLRVSRLPVPVVVVGNITAGGSGKTPLVAALASALAQRGWRPGIVSRGYGRRPANGDAATPLLVGPDTDPAVAGDEPAMLARAGFPVAVAADRVSAGRALIAAHPACDVVIADDGLQHLALARDVEIAVVDGARGMGNGWRIPAGPLREAPSRLGTVDAVVVLADDLREAARFHPAATTMSLEGATFRRVTAPDVTAPPHHFRRGGVHAVAGIGNPQRFFAHLGRLGVDAVPHPFPDHHPFAAADLALPAAVLIVMTEKDAVKCAAFADDRCWYLPVTARLDPALVLRIEEKLRGPQAA